MNNQDFIESKVEEFRKIFGAYSREEEHWEDGKLVFTEGDLIDSWLTETLQQTADHAYREGVESGLNKVWQFVSFKTVALLANYPKKKKYNDGRADGWDTCKKVLAIGITEIKNELNTNK